MGLSGRTFAGVSALAAVLFVAGAFGLVAIDPRWFFDREALYNATVARELLGGHWDLLFQLQYMPFCGGCTVESVLAVGSFKVFGVSFGAWKLVPILFGAGLILAGAQILRRSEADEASLAWLTLMVFPPVLLAQSMVMGWGNHFEVTTLVLVCAGLTETLARRGGGPSRWALLAFLFVFTCWFSLTGAVAGPALLLRLLPRIREVLREHRLKTLAAVTGGALLGAVPWMLFILADQRSPFEFAASFQIEGDRFTHFVGRIEQLSLVAYAGVWQAPGTGVQTVASRVSVVALWTLIAIGLRQCTASPMPFLLAGAYGVVYALSPAEPSSLAQHGLPPPVDQRYLVPWFAALLLCASVGVQSLWNMGRPARVGALLAVGLVVLPGLSARSAWWRATPDRQRVGLNDYLAYDYPLLSGVRLAWLPEATLEARDTSDRLSYEESRRAIGQRLAFEFVELPLDFVPAFAEKIRSSGLEMELVVQGIGRELRIGNVNLGDMRDAPVNYLDRIHAFGALLPPEMRASFYEEVWLANVQLGWSLPDGWQGCGVCPARGAKYVEVFEARPQEDLSSLLPDKLLEAAGAERRDMLLGAGSILGLELGHAPELLPEIGQHLDSADYSILESAFEKGAALRWRR